MKNHSIIFFLSCLLFLSCSKSKYEQEAVAFSKYMQVNFPKVLQNEAAHQILIIPPVGCKGCISKAWDLYQNNSIKSLTFITKDSLEKTNLAFSKHTFLVESDTSFSKFDDLFFVDMYPLLICLSEDGEITEMINLSPEGEKKFLNIIKIVKP